MRTSRHSTRALPLAAFIPLIACNEGPVSPEVGGTTDETSVVGSGPSAARGPSLEFADLEVFFEFNSTDDDLGFHLVLDAVGWDQVTARAPDGRKILQIMANGPLGELGITELRFESAEPSPAEVLALFRPGEYAFVGRTVENGRLLGDADLSGDLPPAPVFTPADGDVVDAASTVIAWAAIPGLEGYEVIVANEDSGLSLSVELGPSATSLQVPAEFMEAGAEYKAEVIAISPNGNKTITENSFQTLP